MEELIKQAFMQVDVLGPHVQEGHYDLIGPNGEIILPSVWEKVIEPDWAITMTMWPLENAPPIASKAPPAPPGARHSHHAGQGPVPRMPPPPPGMGPAGRRSGDMPMPMPDDWHGPPAPRGIKVVNVGPGPKPSKSSSKKNSALVGFFAGQKPKKK